MSATRVEYDLTLDGALPVETCGEAYRSVPRVAITAGLPSFLGVSEWPYTVSGADAKGGRMYQNTGAVVVPIGVSVGKIMLTKG
jgi:hypothetical protein